MKTFIEPELCVLAFQTEDILSYSVDDMMEWEGVEDEE